MKKNLLILAVAAVALASCSNDETIAVNQGGDNSISFNSYVSGMTRATSLQTIDLNTEGFFVTATYTTDRGSAYFTDQQYKYNSAEGHERWEPWTGEAFKTIYWPNQTADVLDFHAYALDHSKRTQLNANTYGLAEENGCPRYVVIPDDDAADQIDFVYATLTGKDYQDNSMSLDFNHVESQVSVKLKNTESGLLFTISEIAIFNIKGSGIYKNRDANPTTATTMSWGDWGSGRNYSQTLGSEIVQDGISDAVNAGTSWILIPQSLATHETPNEYASNDEGAAYEGAYIRVKMKVQSTANNAVYYAGDASNWAYAIWPISGAWTPGYHYTYTIDLSGGGYFEFNQNDNDADIDRVLNLTPITFATVSVSAWTTSNSDVAM